MRVHALGLLLNPGQEWRYIHDEQETSRQRYCLHVLGMTAITPLAAFFGTTVNGWAVDGDMVHLTRASALPLALLSWLSLLAGLLIMGNLIHWMAHTYDSAPSRRECIAFAGYCATPLLLAGATAIQPSPWLGLLAGSAALLHTGWLLYSGLPTFMDIPREEGFLFATSIMTTGLVVLAGLLGSTVMLWGFGLMPVFLR